MKNLSEILSPFAGDRLVEWFADLTLLWHETEAIKPDDIVSPKGLSRWLHYNNYVLWHLEDQARRTDVADDVIVRCKREIDRHNQQRNDAIENIDAWIGTVLASAGIEPGEEVELNSETPGSIIDRLSIASLKIYHMERQTDRKKAGREHRALAARRLEVLKEQSSDLAAALNRLLLDLKQAKKRHKIYRQYKMYNDPRFNPALNPPPGPHSRPEEPIVPNRR